MVDDYTLQPGESLATSVSFMDGGSRGSSTGDKRDTSTLVHDGHGGKAGHRPGFRFADTNDPARLAADAAYEKRRMRLADAWCNDRQQQDSVRNCDASRQLTLDEARAAADAAYKAKKERLAAAWRAR